MYMLKIHTTVFLTISINNSPLQIQNKYKVKNFENYTTIVYFAVCIYMFLVTQVYAN